ncbi:glycosyltransferase [Sphingomonas ginsenosidivorax]|uniref:Glycosyltransferase n=1 Tax=Sphingomonas ginsenosidivorax TaxID=862135 RepID=A0A5C6UAT0_9SPHN|nr:glycosyltransferase family 2 protein [Sphingomonas ginsenosidivorax]TXC69879.1 glycosyltransferase [Sphingomonas ginsenosidivorax]
MRSNFIQDYGGRIVTAWLAAYVHVDAFRLDPCAYLTAAKWWIKRKRVRARGQFAPLLGQSPKAYRLWALRQDRAGRTTLLQVDRPPILALVAAVGDDRELAITLRSLTAQGISAHVIDSGYTPGVRSGLINTLDEIDWASGPWLMPVVAGDRLASGAAGAYRAAIADQGLAEAPTRIVYADDDLSNRRNQRSAPHFKPDWNSELFRHFDYLTGACIVRARRQDIQELSGTQDWAQQLVIRAAGKGVPFHVREVLHHRRARIAPSVAAAPIVLRGDLPPVTVIIPIRNRVDLLRTCLDGVAATKYPDIEVIVVDNDSDDPQTLSYLAALDPARHRVVRHPGPFNYSAMNNRAVAGAHGQLICLLNNDVEVLEPDWLAMMAVQAMRKDVGAVGARLLYPDGRIQHAGVVIGVGNAAGHAHRFVHPDEEGYFRRHALAQFTTAVTGACLLVQRERFEAVGGLDEHNFAVAFNDVDLCLRLNQRGWQSLYEPRATLIHHESVSRGFDRDVAGAARFAGELAALQRIWKTDEIIDPWHHPHLSRAAERFTVMI